MDVVYVCASGHISSAQPVCRVILCPCCSVLLYNYLWRHAYTVQVDKRDVHVHLHVIHIIIKVSAKKACRQQHQVTLLLQRGLDLQFIASLHALKEL